MKKIDFKKLKVFLSNLFCALARHAFLAFLVLLCIALLLGEFLFYKYSILTEKKEPQISGQTIQFKEDLYQKVLGEWQAREEKLKATETKEYPDPFKIDSTSR